MAALVFLSFAPEDSTHRDALVKQLAPLVAAHVIDVWDAGSVAAGEERAESVARKLALSTITRPTLTSRARGPARPSARRTTA